MACHIAKTQLLRTAAVRCYSTNPSVAFVGGVTDYDVQTTTLPNKMIVASADNVCPITRVSIVLRSGARYETAQNMGAAHVLRIAAGLSTKHASQFAIMRNVQQVGANMTCTADRETVAYTLEGTCEALEKSINFLGEVATAQVFKPWELSDNVGRIKLELATRPPQMRAVDLLHKAAYRVGLGNSLFVMKHRVGKISSETMQQFFNSTFTADRCAVVGLGIDHAYLSSFAKELQLNSGGGADAEASPYKGGEIRSDKGGDLAYVALATAGAAASNRKEALAFGVLQQALGTGARVKYGRETAGALSKAVGSLEEDYSLSALNVNYSDSGLFGIIAVCPGKVAGKVTDKAASVLRSGNIGEADFNRGKNQLIASTLLTLERGRNQLTDMGEQALLLGSVEAPAKVIAQIESLTLADVNAAAKKVAGGKLTIASVGNIKNVPYLTDLK